MDKTYMEYAAELKELINNCADYSIEESDTYKKALVKVKEQCAYSADPFLQELIKLVSTEIEDRALNVDTSKESTNECVISGTQRIHLNHSVVKNSDTLINKSHFLKHLLNFVRWRH